jgi:hypothetical protein
LCARDHASLKKNQASAQRPTNGEITSANDTARPLDAKHPVSSLKHDLAILNRRAALWQRTALPQNSTQFRHFSLALAGYLPYWYQCTMKTIERVQTGVRLEKRTLKVLKGLAEYLDLTLGDLLEGIVLHTFEGKAPFSEKTLKQIEHLRRVYGLDLTSEDSHRLVEEGARRAKR